tara:strand:+ start:162 stop:545 length:384 start_codon:yes stop_codon:yes gene_type:complete
MANKKDPPNNKLAAALTAGISSALVWNQNRMVNKDARLLQTSQKTLNPTSKSSLSFEEAKDTVSLLRENKKGKKQLRGLRASGQLQDIGDWRKGKRTARKTARMKKKYGEMKGGGIVFTRTTRRHGS